MTACEDYIAASVESVRFALLSGPDASRIEALQTELETIVRAANIVPMRSSELFFELKSHIDHTRSNWPPPKREAG